MLCCTMNSPPVTTMYARMAVRAMASARRQAGSFRNWGRRALRLADFEMSGVQRSGWICQREMRVTAKRHSARL